MNGLVIVEKELNAMAPQIAEAIPPGANLPVEKMIRSIIISCERTPKLLDCNRQSVINSAWSAAILGLEVDGVTGQAYMIPFKGQATLQIGYKGFSTLAARSGFILHGGVIREGDEYDYQLGTDSFVHVKPKLGGATKRAVIGAWASMTSLRFPTICDLMDVDEIEKVRKVSKYGAGGPWGQWYDQMAVKTIKKRLAKSSPLNLLHLAAELDSQGEIGNHAYIRPEDHALVMDTGETVFPPGADTPQKPSMGLPPYKVGFPDGKTREFQTVSEWASFILSGLERASDANSLRDFVQRNNVNIDYVKRADEVLVSDVEAKIKERILALEA